MKGVKKESGVLKRAAALLKQPWLNLIMEAMNRFQVTTSLREEAGRGLV